MIDTFEKVDVNLIIFLTLSSFQQFPSILTQITEIYVQREGQYSKMNV